MKIKAFISKSYDCEGMVLYFSGLSVQHIKDYLDAYSTDDEFCRAIFESLPEIWMEQVSVKGKIIRTYTLVFCIPFKYWTEEDARKELERIRDYIYARMGWE